MKYKTPTIKKKYTHSHTQTTTKELNYQFIYPNQMAKDEKKRNKFNKQKNSTSSQIKSSDIKVNKLTYLKEIIT